MDQDELLRYLVEALGGLGIEYLNTGSAATIYYGTRAERLGVADPWRRVRARVER